MLKRKKYYFVSYAFTCRTGAFGFGRNSIEVVATGFLNKPFLAITDAEKQILRLPDNSHVDKLTILGFQEINKETFEGLKNE